MLCTRLCAFLGGGSRESALCLKPLYAGSGWSRGLWRRQKGSGEGGRRQNGSGEAGVVVRSSMGSASSMGGSLPCGAKSVSGLLDVRGTEGCCRGRGSLRSQAAATLVVVGSSSRNSLTGSPVQCPSRCHALVARGAASRSAASWQASAGSQWLALRQEAPQVGVQQHQARAPLALLGVGALVCQGWHPLPWPCEASSLLPAQQPEPSSWTGRLGLA